MSKLLYDEPPLQVQPSLAVLIGLHESIILQQIHYWVVLNEKAKKNFRDGFYWTYNSYEDWQKQFPFWHADTIRRTIGKLEANLLLITGNFNKAKFDRTKWYRIDHERLESLKSRPLVQTVRMDTDEVSAPIPETTREAHFTPVHELGMLSVVSRALKSKGH